MVRKKSGPSRALIRLGNERFTPKKRHRDTRRRARRKAVRPVSDLPAFDRPAPMERHGVYNRRSRVQAAGLAPAVPLLEQAARTVPLAAVAQPVVIADLARLRGATRLSRWPWPSAC